jgi:predicted nuclease with TOPRIM domain
LLLHRNSLTTQLSRSESDYRNSLNKIGDLEKALEELKSYNQEKVKKLADAARVNKEQERLLNTNSISLEKLTRENASLEDKIRGLEGTITQMEINLTEQRAVHESVSNVSDAGCD